MTEPAGGEVEVWRVAVTPASSRAAEAGRGLLDAEELRRAGAFHREADRALYVVAHVGLRLVLGAKLGVPAEKVMFGRAACPGCGGPHGRPGLADGGPLEFSLSHTGGLALIATARDVVGVDVERRALTEAAGREIAGQLHPAERAALAALPEARRTDATLSCWVRKEAYLKGTGFGLSRGADTDFVGLGPEYPARAGAAPPPAQPVGWALVGVPVPDGYAAAAALRRPAGPSPVRVRAHDLDLADRHSPG